MSKKFVMKDDIPDSGESSWCERRDIHPLDTLLRKHGFKIHGRPRGSSPTWAKDGEVLIQEDALLTLPPKEVSAARGLDETTPTRKLFY